MTASEQIAHELAAHGGVLTYADVPSLRASLTRAVNRGELVRVLPGHFAAPAPDCLTRCWAATRWRPGLVMAGAAALHLHGLGPDPGVVDVVSRAVRQMPAGFRLSRRNVDEPWLRWLGDIRVEHPAAAAVDLATLDDGEAIDAGLRMRLFSVSDLDRALEAFSHRAGNGYRHTVVQASRGNPWSGGERRFHRLLYEAGIAGWIGNYRVVFENRVYYIDVLFEKARLAIEFDGFGSHGDAGAFERDRLKGNDLAALDYTLLRFTRSMLVNDPEYVLREIPRHLIRKCPQ